MFHKVFKALGLLKDKEIKSSLYRKEVQENQPELSHSDLEKVLIEVAQEFEDPNKFSEAAQRVAGKLTFKQAERLTQYFHDTPAAPEALKETLAKYGLLGVWLNVCQDSIFEIFFNYKEEAIPTLYALMFGEYDWTQYKAIDVLCRFAKKGIRTDGIINDIGKNLSQFRYETVFSAIESLSKIKNHKSIPKILLTTFDRYSKEDPIEGLHILQFLAINYPDQAREKLRFVKSIVKDKNNFEEEQIEAAIFSLQLDAKDEEIIALLDHWELNAEEQNQRERITQFKKQMTSKS